MGTGSQDGVTKFHVSDFRTLQANAVRSLKDAPGLHQRDTALIAQFQESTGQFVNDLILPRPKRF